MKRYSKIILILLLITIAVASPLVAHAGPIDWLLSLLGSVGEGMAYIIAMVIKYLVYEPSIWILRAAAFVFDTVVPFSLGTGSSPDAFKSAFVATGWATMRDIANMAFIFAMLYISLATILQLGAGRNMRAFLVNILIIALFVNFSLFLAQVVIDGANLLALEFYEVLSASDHGLAAIFLQGFNPQKLLNTHSFEDWITGYNQSYAVLLVLYLFGGITQLVAAYMIFWASFLFIGRIVILWILMIVSPLAFAAYILPGTQKYFNDWWSRLLNQAFVAPIFLFFFFIFALFISGGGLQSVLATAATSAGSSPIVQIILEVVLGFSLVVAFLFVALKQTKKFGGEAAAWATKAAGYTVGVAAAAAGGVVGAPVAGFAARFGGARLLGAMGAGTGGEVAGFARAAGRITGVPLREVAGKAGAAARAGIGEAAKKVTEAGAAPGLGGAALRGFGIARGAGLAEAGIRAGIKANIEKAEKDMEGLNENALRTEYGYATTTAEKRAGIIKVLGKRKKLQPQEEGAGPMTRDSIVETLKTVKSRGYDTEKEIENPYLWQYATTEDERAKAAKTLSVDAFKEIGKAKREVVGADGKKIELPSDFFDITKNADGTENTEVFDRAIQNMTSAHFKMLLDPEVRDDFSKQFFENLKKAMEREKKKTIKKLEAAGGKEETAKAADLESGKRKYVIEEYFKDIQNTRGGAAIKDPSLRGFFAENDIPYKKKKKGGGGADEESDEGGNEEAEGGTKKEEGPGIFPGRAYRTREEAAGTTAPNEALKSAADIAAERAEAIKKEPPPHS